jgi:hypothetical protein
MFSETVHNDIKACADRCKLCGCFRLPQLHVEEKAGRSISTMRCAVCKAAASGSNMFFAIFEWNKLQRGVVK